ncbi:MAG: hypothetical protein ACRCWJ_19265, partial [Casimicrobium sp.]
MPSLAACMKKAGDALAPDDKKAIVDAAREYRTMESMSATAAAKKAIDDQVAAINAELAEEVKSQKRARRSSVVEETAQSTADAPKPEPEAPKQEAKREPAKQPKEITDVGEKIGGARKDWRDTGLTLADIESMSGGEESENVKKANIWKPDYAGMIERGAEPQTAALVKIIVDRLAAQPKTDSPESRRQYLQMMLYVKQAFEGVKTTADVSAAGQRLKYELVGLPKDKTIRGTAEDRAKRDMLFSVYKGRSDPFIISSYTDLRRAKDLVAEGWPTAKAKRAPVAKTKTDEKQEPKRPHLEGIQRTGKDIREGRDVSAQEFMETFGFRGVEFGNWAAQDERQKIVNLAYDALQDLAGVLGIPPRAVSLNGSLGLGLASRGSG